MVLRSVKNGKPIKEYEFDFDIASNGASSGSSGKASNPSSGSGGSSGGGSGSGPVAKKPSGSTSDRSPSLQWTGDYDKYYVKVVNGSGKTVFGKTITAKSARCDNDTDCTVTLPTLSKGSYLWRVRGVMNSGTTNYSSLQMKIQ